MLLFAVDGGRQKGYGHAIRASVLAHTCMGRDLGLSFVCGNRDVSEYLKKRGFARVQVTPEEHLLSESASQRPSVLVWDAGRPLLREEVEHLHDHGVWVLEFDAADRKSYADEVVNGFEPTLYSATGHQYQLVGPDYFVIDKSFCNAKEWRSASSVLQTGLGLFICFGGADPGQLLEPTLEILADIPQCRSLFVRAVAGFDGRRAKAIRHKFSALKNLQVYAEADAVLVAQQMRFSYLGIISFGTILVEAMAAELPVLVINPTQAHQDYAIRVLKGIFAGTGQTFGCPPQIDWIGLRKELIHLMERPRDLERMQVATRRLVDGQGAQRIIRYIYNFVMRSRAKKDTLVSSSAR